MSKFFGGNSRDIGDAHLQAEINSKMARVLEDALLKNVQLQSDMETIANEVTRLEQENARLLAQQKNDTQQ